MQTAPIFENEPERLKALTRLGILDTQSEERFDAITKKLIDEFRVPIATISIIDKNREWFKSCQGLLQREGKRDVSFCGHAMFSKHLFIVEDTLKDQRFVDNPYVVGSPFIRFYAGVALHDELTKLPIGVLCIKDKKPRTLSVDEINQLVSLGEQTEQMLNHPNN